MDKTPPTFDVTGYARPEPMVHRPPRPRRQDTKPDRSSQLQKLCKYSDGTRDPYVQDFDKCFMLKGLMMYILWSKDLG